MTTKSQNSSTMHVFDRKNGNWISFFFNSIFFGVADAPSIVMSLMATVSPGDLDHRDTQCQEQSWKRMKQNIRLTRQARGPPDNSNDFLVCRHFCRKCGPKNHANLFAIFTEMFLEWCWNCLGFWFQWTKSNCTGGTAVYLILYPTFMPRSRWVWFFPVFPQTGEAVLKWSRQNKCTPSNIWCQGNLSTLSLFFFFFSFSLIATIPIAATFIPRNMWKRPQKTAEKSMMQPVHLTAVTCLPAMTLLFSSILNQKNSIQANKSAPTPWKTDMSFWSGLEALSGL